MKNVRQIPSIEEAINYEKRDKTCFMKYVTSNYWCERHNGEFPQEVEGSAAQGGGAARRGPKSHFGNV